MEYQKGAVRPVECISEGWNIVKDNYGIFLGMFVVAGIILVIAGLILGAINTLVVLGITAALGSATQNSGQVGAVSTAIIPQLASLIISIFTNTIVFTISGVLFCGIYKALSLNSSGETANFSDLFGEFNKITPCLIVAVLTSLFQFVLGLTGLFVGATIGISALSTGILMSDGKMNPALFGGLLAGIGIFVLVYLIISLVFSALTTFVYPLIVEKNLSGGEAIRLSIKSGLANIGGLILLFLLLGLMAFGGILLCGIGLLFVLPITTAAVFAAFQNVFGKADNFRQNTPPPPPNFDNQAAY